MSNLQIFIAKASGTCQLCSGSYAIGARIAHNKTTNSYGHAQCVISHLNAGTEITRSPAGASTNSEASAHANPLLIPAAGHGPEFLHKITDRPALYVNKGENMQTNNQQDEHVFGVSDKLTADGYDAGTIVEYKPTEFLGRLRISIEEDRLVPIYAGYLKGSNAKQQFKLGIKNEVRAARKFGIKSYEELLNRTLILKVVNYRLAPGFVLVGVK